MNQIKTKLVSQIISNPGSTCSSDASLSSSWSPLSCGFYKLNTDAAFGDQETGTDLDFLLWDSSNCIVIAQSLFLPVSYTPLLELHAILEGIILAWLDLLDTRALLLNWTPLKLSTFFLKIELPWWWKCLDSWHQNSFSLFGLSSVHPCLSLTQPPQ